MTTIEAARCARVSAATVRAWCRSGRLAAVKHAGRWVIRASALARLVCPVTDWLRPGQRSPQVDGRAARRRAARADARAAAAEHATRPIRHWERARIAAANSGRILARQFLQDLGFDEAWIGKYESWFGRKTAEAFRAKYGCEPEHGGIVVLRGRLWHVMRYRDVRDLEAGARAYSRTRHLFTDMGVAA